MLQHSIWARLRKFIGRHIFLFRLLSTMLIACLIPVLLLIVFNTRQRSADIEYQLHRQSELVAESVVAQFENCIDTVRELNSRIATDRTLLNVEQLSGISAERSFLSTLGNLNSTLPFLEEFCIFIPGEPGEIYAPRGKYWKDIYATEVLRMDAEQFAMTLESVESGKIIPWSRDSRISVYLHPIRIYGASHTSAVGIHVFSHYSLSSLFKSTLPKGYGISEIYGPDETLIYRSPSSPIDVGIFPSERRYVDPSTEISYLLGSASGSKGYSCVTYVQEDMLTQNVTWYTELSRLFIVMAFLFCIVLLGILIAVNYLPIIHLLKHIGRQKVDDQDEFTAIYEALSQQEVETDRLQRMLEQQRLTMADYVYSRLISGGKLSPQDTAFLEKNTVSYFVAVAALDKVQDADVILEQNRPDGNIFAVELYRDGYLVLICRFKLEADEVLQQIHQLLVNTEIGISSTTTDFRDLHDCFEEACAQLRKLQSESDDCEDTASGTPATDVTAAILVEYVDAHYTDADFGVASAADYLGISEYSTGKLLRNIYGANFRRVINEKRIAYAKMLLMSSDESVGEIGRMSGFMSTSYFIKVFRDSENITPAQFRQIANEN